MGASPCDHTTAGHEERSVALHELQARFMVQNYDLTSVLQGFRDFSRQAVKAVDATGDKCGLIKLFGTDLPALDTDSHVELCVPQIARPSTDGRLPRWEKI